MCKRLKKTKTKPVQVQYSGCSKKNFAAALSLAKFFLDSTPQYSLSSTAPVILQLGMGLHCSMTHCTNATYVWSCYFQFERDGQPGCNEYAFVSGRIPKRCPQRIPIGIEARTVELQR